MSIARAYAYGNAGLLLVLSHRVYADDVHHVCENDHVPSLNEHDYVRVVHLCATRLQLLQSSQLTKTTARGLSRTEPKKLLCQ